MYHCHLHFYLVGQDPGLWEPLRALPAYAEFTHYFAESAEPEREAAAAADVIFADLRGQQAEAAIAVLSEGKRPEAELIILAEDGGLAGLSDKLGQVTDFWKLPMSADELRFRFARWQQHCKNQRDNWQTEQFLEAVINGSPNLIWYKDKNGIHEKVNDSFCQTVNKPKEKVQGRGHAYIWDVEQDDPACIESENRVMATRQTHISDEVIQTGAGERVLATYKSPLYDLDGSVMGTVGVAIDVTKERAYAEELIRRNQALEKVLSTLECGLIEHTPDGREIISINQAALDILDYESKEQMMADGFNAVAQTVMDKDKPRLRRQLARLQGAGDAINIEYDVQHRDGEILHIMGTAKLVEQNGELLCQRYLFDCTEQKRERQEEERRQMELIYALSREYSLVCYLNLDTGLGHALRIGECQNHILQDIFSDEFSIDESIGRYIEAGVYDEDKEMLAHALSKEALGRGVSGGLMYSVNYRTTCCGELRYFQMKAVRAGEWGANHGVVMGFRSIDDETRSDREQRTLLENALSQANRASRAKTVFLSNMSHDIRTPMNAIIGFTTLAISHIDEREQVEGYLQKIMTSGNHLLNLINDILDMSHIESGKVHLEEEVCSLPDIMRELANIIQVDINAKQLALQIDALAVQNEQVYCDRLRLNQMLLNIFSNAIKYTEPGGSVSLRVREIDGAPRGFANYEFVIRDTGIGMSEDFISHIFEPFERERNSTISKIQGTGLGMAITRNIIDMMNGTINITSRVGEGTEVVVCLPMRVVTDKKELQGAAEGKKAVPPAAAAVADKYAGSRILLAEDNELNQEIAVAILEEAGFLVDVADNGRIAVDKLIAAEPGYYQVVLMDVQMPVMDGYAATRAIRSLPEKDLAGIPILAMTANAFEEDRQEALMCGMNEHIAKPIDVDKLMVMLTKVLSKAEEN